MPLSAMVYNPLPFRDSPCPREPLLPHRPMSPGRRPLLGKIRNDVTKVETYVKCRHCYGDRPLPTDQNGGTEVRLTIISGSQEDFPARESLM